MKNIRMLFVQVVTLLAVCGTISPAFADVARPKGSVRFQTLSAQKSPLPSAELDGELNTLVTYINGMTLVQNASQWYNPSLPAAYVNTTQFAVSGNHTAEFLQYRRLKITLTSTTVYSEVVSSVYSSGPNSTTVTILDAILLNPITLVEYSMLGPTTSNGAISASLATGYPAATAATANTLAVRDGSGGLAASTFTGNVTSGYNGVPVGAVMPFAMNSCPAGWLDAKGTPAVSRTTYSALFAAIGTTFGVGDGSTTFNLPDLRGEFIRGWDNSRGVDTGRTFGSFQADDLKSHTHSALIYGGSSYNLGSATPYLSSGTTGATGGAETRPRNVALLYCIKY